MTASGGPETYTLASAGTTFAWTAKTQDSRITMEGTITVIAPDGSIALDILDAPPTLEDLQGMIGGWLEKVPGLSQREGKACVAFVDEEGRSKLLDKNFLATEIWRTCAPEHWDGMHIRGPMVIIEGDAELMGAL